MERAKKKSTGFYPTPTALVTRLMDEYLKTHSGLPSALIEPSAGEGHFIIATWEAFSANKEMTKRQIESMVRATILLENDREIFQNLKSNIGKWCTANGVKARPEMHHDNFLLNGHKYLRDLGNSVLVVGNPPWDEFTTRKHDGKVDLDQSRKERMYEKAKYQALGFKNVYQCFLYELMAIKSANLSILFVLPRQLLGDLSSQGIREQLLETGTVDLTVYCNKDEPDFYFEAVDRAAEILCLQYSRSEKREVRIRRGFEQKFRKTKPFGSDHTIPCPFTNGTEDILQLILNNASLADWDFAMEVTVSRGKVNYTNSNYKNATNGRTLSAYQFENGKSTEVILNKILPNSRRKLKAAVLKTKDSISDSMLKIKCKNELAHPYLMLILNSRPVELALRSVISNINLNNFRLMSLPIPQPSERMLTKARLLCEKCQSGELSWEKASDELARDIYQLSSSDLAPLKDLFPDRVSDKAA